MGGLAAGTVAYFGAEWYYQNFQIDGILAERREFAKNATKWNAQRLDREIRDMNATASSLRAQAVKVLQ